MFLLASAGGVEASSFVYLKAVTEEITPSMTVAGPPEPIKLEPVASLPGPDPEPDDGPSVITYDPPSPLIRQISASIIAFGEPQLPVTPEQVASIGDNDGPRNPFRRPTVIRGGVTGDLFRRAPGAAAVAAPTEEKRQPVAEARNKQPAGQPEPQRQPEPEPKPEPALPAPRTFKPE